MFCVLTRAEKYRLCIVDGKGRFKKSEKYCPKLDQPGSKVECVVAVDRLDCLRRLAKRSVDFSVFTAEDIMTAENAGIEDILLINELRFTPELFEYQVVAVIDNRANIKSRHDLKDKKFCHPGYGYEADWTRILSNYLEASVATPSCDQSLTLIENRVKATSDFFGSACKAGPWVNNPQLDTLLKEKYQHLCDLCGDPSSCSRSDKYWGRKGSLLCLTDGIGEISWARLDDVQQHFGLLGEDIENDPAGYSFLCPDDTLLPVNTTKPCIWVEKPWRVVASRRAVAQEIQEMVSSLQDKDPHNWKNLLRYLLDTTFADFKKIEPATPIETYLYRAKGYISANSFSGCHPPRTIWLCTRSIKETAKCQWLRESANVYGIEPDIECLKADNTSHCMKAVAAKVADVVIVPSDMVGEAMKKYDLQTLFYETVRDADKYITVGVTRSNVEISSWKDLRGKKCCFPSYDGVAWNTVKYHLFNENIIKYCPLDWEMASFFGQICTPNLPTSLLPHINELCQNGTFSGDHGALDCLSLGVGDVAFVSKNSLSSYVSERSINSSDHEITTTDFKVMCLSDTETCHLSWTTPGRAMIRKNVTDLWIKDAMDVFMHLGELFGKNHKSSTVPVTLFGKYDGSSDLVFHDVTRNLRKVPIDRISDKMPFDYDSFLNIDSKCVEYSRSLPVAKYSLMLLVKMLILNKIL